MENRLTPVELKDRLQGLLGLTTMTIATTSGDKEPHAAAVFFACDNQLNLFFFSSPQSQHSIDISHQPRAAVAIYPECFGWQDIHGLQMRGEISHLKGQGDWQLAWELYQIKFPFISDLHDILARNQPHRFSPDWIRLVDNREGFGYKWEWAVDRNGSKTANWWRLTFETRLVKNGHG